MSRARLRGLILLLSAGGVAACAGSAAPTRPTPSPRPASTIALPTAPPPSPTRSALPSLTATGSPIEQPYPYLPPDRPLRLTHLEMTSQQAGWASYQSEDGITHLLRTEDGGVRWADVTPPLILPAENEAQAPRRLRLAAHYMDGLHAWVSVSLWPGGRFESVWRTTDGGSQWERVPLGRRNLGDDWIRFDFVDPLHGWAVIDVFHGAGSHSGEAFRTVDGGRTWERLLENFSNASAIDFVDQEVGWISTDVFAGVSPPWRLFITLDGGLTWRSTSPSAQGPIPEPVAGHRDCAFQVLHTLSAQSGVVLRPDCTTLDSEGQPALTAWLDLTTDGGRSWQFLPLPPGPPEFINPDQGWVIGASEFQSTGQPIAWTLYRTEDGGRSWQDVRQMEWHGELSFVDDRNGWGLDQDGRLWRTSDGGASWGPIPASSGRGSVPQDRTVTHSLPAASPAISKGSLDRLELLASLPATDPTSALVFRETLYVGNASGQLLVWPLESELDATPAIWRAHSDWVYDLAAVEEGGQVVSASRDGSVRRWHVFDPEGYWDQATTHRGEALSVALSPNGLMLASGGEDGIIRAQQGLGMQTPELQFELADPQGWVWDLAFSADGSRLASASGDRLVRLWSIESGALAGTLSGHSSTVSQVAFSPDGRHLASASWDGTARIWNAQTLETETELQGHSDWVLGLAYAPGGDLLATASADGSVLLWDPDEGQLLTKLIQLDGPVRSLAFDPQGRYLITVSDDDLVRIWGLRPN